MRHTCDGEDVSPSLLWSGLPEGTRSLALVVYDPDAPGGTFFHWLAWGIDAAAGGIGEGEAAPVEGRNDFGKSGYAGPCPPHDHGPHRYVVRLDALDRDLDISPGADREQIEAAIRSLRIGGAELTGTYERR
ncbi:MAG: YbhB/YbcL family Raf kinase inhibitor-like protein [Candidatus Limnocylindria bacterium]